nr:protein kinase wis1 [Quercus suber]
MASEGEQDARESPSTASPADSPSERPQPSHSNSDMGSPPSGAPMSASSQPLGNVNAARRPAPANAPARAGPAGINNPDIAARMKAFSMSRSKAPPAAVPGRGPAVQSPGPSIPGFPQGFTLPTQLNRPQPHFSNSSPVLPVGRPPGPGGMSLAEKRGMRLPGGLPGQPPSANPGTAAGAPATGPAKRQKPKMSLADIHGSNNASGGSANGVEAQQPSKQQSNMEKYAEFIDTKKGALTFKGKAVVDGSGIVFESGRSFSISLDEVDTLDELGKGNYGTVYKVRHSRPRFRKQGQGLAGNKAPKALHEDEVPPSPTRNAAADARNGGATTGVVMAMKEMRLELDDAKFASIIMELDILHRCTSAFIVDFYGAFFQEGAVYICMEFMDGGSIDKLYGDGIPEGVLQKITYSTVMGLKSLKEEHNIIHRDVKPTNILVNSRGQVKICDFGVSGNLVASIAKTNIGCQSYMAPERISGGGGAADAGAGGSVGTYSVQSDIWSLGLTMIECAMGHYPYPPETYNNIFSQLAAIVDGDPPDLPAESFSDAARDFVAGCLNKIPKLRPTYPMLLQHAWLAPLAKPETIAEEDEEAAEAAAAAGEDLAVPTNPTGSSTTGIGVGPDGFVDKEVGEWVLDAQDRRKRGVMTKSAQPALHAAPLDAAALGSPVAA